LAARETPLGLEPESGVEKRKYKSEKGSQCWLPFFYMCLTMSYFHTGIRTIIGAEAFHCPVRDGKEWYHFAMVIRLNGLLKLRA
jgi:hypothetical protein